jgi:hypothetical protein
MPEDSGGFKVLLINAGVAMKRQRDMRERQERVEGEDGQFYEAMPSVEAPLYRDTYVEREREVEDGDRGMSGWAILGLVLLGLLLLLLLTGNLFNNAGGGGAGTGTGGTTAPTQTIPDESIETPALTQ